MEVKVFIAERVFSEDSHIAKLDEKGLPIEWTTLSKLYADGWVLKTISPVPEEDPLRSYVVVER